ncbi:hypothetical protein BTO09_10155 [Gilvibacter sp. SZ-19]|nr:hypothetical protein BTO09_10155 [Gilvibacter sp. SZ-19]
MKKITLILLVLLGWASTHAQDINIQDGTFFLCTGTLYDTGGPAAPYSNDETIVMTLCSDTPGIGIELDFTFFSTQAGADVLTIYDGPDTASPVIGDFSGTAGPGFVAATGASGCLTLEWNSDFVINSPGWEANISCCQVINAVFDSSTPPAAADGTISAAVGENITFNGSAVFSMDGTGATYEWDFGDGATAFGTTVVHAYAASGAYPVTLTVTDAAGCTNNDDIDITALIGFGGADPGNLFVDAGPDVTLDCDAGGSVTLVADFQEIFETFSTDYTVSPIVYSPPFPFDGLANSIDITSDDTWSAVDTLPFDFCFFGDLEQEFQVGSNGVIRFDVDPGDASNGWAFSEDLPNNTNPTLGEANVFTPVHDIHPGINPGNEIGYEVLGTYPNRALVVSFYEVAMFSGTCNDLLATHMAVFYEFSNIIDIYIQDKPVCPTWNSGNAAVGIQNNDGDLAYVPPGRNTSDSPWTTTNEAWRFAPAGAPSYVFEWLDDTGAVVGISPTLTVSPTVTTTYTARVTYTNTCNGEIVVLEDEVIVTVDTPFTVDLGPDMSVCDGGPIILDADPGVPGVTYEWYQDGTLLPGETASTYTATTSGTYRVIVSDGSCDAGDDITLIIGTTPVPGTPDPLEICDFPFDGFAEFTLTDADAQIIDGGTGLVVRYYETLALADVGDPADALISPYTNTSDPQTVYARLEESASGCYATVELVLDVLDGPVVNDPIPDYVLCDDPSNDGIALFDLTTMEPLISPAPAGVIFTYHETAADAAAGTAPIATPTAYNNISNPQTIYVRLESTDGCISVGEFNLVVDPVPVFVDPTPYILCDDGVADGFTEFDLTVKIPEITGGAVDLAVSFYLTLADADAGAPALPTNYTNVTNPQTIYVRVESITTGCYDTTTLELEVLDAPAAVTPTPLEYCDPDNDGFGVFTLEDATLEITGGDPDVVVTYHETFADATNGVLPLTSPYNNIVFGTQTVYARVANAVTTGDECFVIVELQLIVLDTPQIVDPEPLLACDDNDDGIVVFDLTVKAPEILDGLDPADYTVEYYEDAAFTSLIAPATAYTNLTNPQTVFVLVTDNTNLCTATTTLELIVNFPPEVFPPAPLELCDVNNPGDEVEEFDLELATPEITGGDTSLIVTYHETAADADTGDNPLTSPYTNTSNPQTIYVRVEDPDTGCFVSDVVTLDLRVNPQPSPTPDPTPIEICDADNDGFVDNFILTDRDVEIINGEPDVVVSYHETLADAQADLFPLSSPYANIVAYSQIVYARVENTLTGCFTIVELELIVLNSPELPLEIEDYVICDDDDDGIAVFDLTTKDPEIYGSQDPATLDLSYHLSEADALAGVMPIVTPAAFVNTTNPQTIWVRLFDPVTGCASVGSFELIVSLPPVIAAPGDLDALERCDDETADGFASFDLTQAEDDITLGAPGLLVQYYTTEMDAQDDTNAIDPATDYTNTVNPQTIWVRVTDGDTGCVSFTTLTIRVLPNPSPNTDPDPIEVCDEVTVGDGIEVIDLTQREAEIIGGEPGVSASYYETEADARIGDPLLAIADPTAYSNIETPQIIWVRITNDTTGCFTLVELPIIVHPLPEAPEVSDYIICEVATDGVATFDLNTKIPEILGGQDPTDLQVSFHEVEADADAGINAIATPEAFVNVTNPQTIYVRITNTVTGCYSATQSFNIEVREGATATAPAAVYRICDNVGDGTDGIGEFTLSTQDAEILGGQDPVIYVVSYHASDADATTGDNALPDSYINTENPQVIWARVTNTDTGCFAITTLTLEVSPLPVISLEDSYRLCVDEFGNPIQNESGEASPPVLNTGLSDLDYTFEWFLNGNPLPETTSSIVARAGGTYTVIATETTSGLGCSAEASTTVTVSSPPTTFSAEVITNAFADDHQIQAEASGLGVYFFQLDDGPLQESGLFTNVSPGDHIVTIVDQNGCGSVSIPVGVIDYPLFFTPNQDGYHDTWNIIGIASNPTAQIYIYDRFGKLLKQLSPLGPGWDGTYNGNPMPSSDYWFQVIYDEDEVEKEFRGHFTLKR